MALIELNQVGKSFAGKTGPIHAVNGINLAIDERMFMASLVIQELARAHWFVY